MSGFWEEHNSKEVEMKFSGWSVALLLVITLIMSVVPVCGEEMENQHATAKKDPSVTDCLAPGHKAASQG
jgi:hypothetical protein